MNCRGCGLRTHAGCLAWLEIGSDGRWPCDECQRRRDGVVPGNNPTWLRLKAARLDGDKNAISAPRPSFRVAMTAAAGRRPRPGRRRRRGLTEQRVDDVVRRFGFIERWC